MKFILLVNVKNPKNVGILKHDHLRVLKHKNLNFSAFYFYEQLKFHTQLS